jgi:cobalamin biosynthesis Mg chelatase CobN
MATTSKAVEADTIPPGGPSDGEEASPVSSGVPLAPTPVVVVEAYREGPAEAKAASPEAPRVSTDVPQAPPQAQASATSRPSSPETQLAKTQARPAETTAKTESKGKVAAKKAKGKSGKTKAAVTSRDEKRTSPRAGPAVARTPDKTTGRIWLAVIFVVVLVLAYALARSHG